MVDWVVLVDCMEQYTRVGIIDLVDLQWLSAQASMQVLIWSASDIQYCFIKSINGDKGAVFFPEARCAFNCFHSALFFAYRFYNSQKSYQGKHVSCLVTAESHPKCNALVLQARVHNIERARETCIYIIITEELCRSLKEQSAKWRDFISTLK